MIPLNTTDQAQVAADNAARIRNEVEQVEDHVFAKPWKTAYGNKQVPEHIYIGCIKEFRDITLGEEHWKAIVADIKAAGYFVYRQMYHNSYYGYTKVYDHVVTKAPLTMAQRDIMHLQDEWSRPSGPGGEQMRGEML